MREYDRSWAKTIIGYIKAKYKFDVTLQRESYNINDPYNEYFVLYWDINGNEYHVKINIKDIGPSRTKDALDNFRIGLAKNYPELLL